MTLKHSIKLNGDTTVLRHENTTINQENRNKSIHLYLIDFHQSLHEYTMEKTVSSINGARKHDIQILDLTI
jgi:hypothetical protein